MKYIRKHWHANTQAEVADVFGQSVRTIQSWATAGMPGKSGRYPLGKIARWLRTQGPWRAKMLAGDDLLMQGDDSPALERFRAARASQEELKLAEMDGSLCNVEYLNSICEMYFRRFAKTAEALRKQFGEEAVRIFEDGRTSCARDVLASLSSLKPKKE